MKTRNVLTILLLLFITMGFAGCNDNSDEKLPSEKCDCGEQYIRDIESIGTLSYNEKVGKWLIASTIQGTYDSVYLLLISGDKDMKMFDKQTVCFTGKMYTLTSEKPFDIPAGTEIYCLILESIKIKT
ncbi:MAG: hypothetical protein IJ604_07630 [Prevotella sp.]|nr:hypothetical protein [Prevotella sp.]